MRTSRCTQEGSDGSREQSLAFFLVPELKHAGQPECSDHIVQQEGWRDLVRSVASVVKPHTKRAVNTFVLERARNWCNWPAEAYEGTSRKATHMFMPNFSRCTLTFQEQDPGFRSNSFACGWRGSPELRDRECSGGALHLHRTCMSWCSRLAWRILVWSTASPMVDFGTGSSISSSVSRCGHKKPLSRAHASPLRPNPSKAHRTILLNSLATQSSVAFAESCGPGKGDATRRRRGC